jgi:hypothetical protein
MSRLFFVLIACLLPTAAAAQCVTDFNGRKIVLDQQMLDAEPAAPGLRERVFDWPSRSWDRALGRPRACDSQTIIAFLSGRVSADDLDGYCLSRTEADDGWLLVPGRRNYRGQCRRTTCEKVNLARDEARDAAGAMVGLMTGETALPGVQHPAGATIATGAAKYLAGQLASLGTPVATALATPAALSAAAVSVVAVGGAVYLCRE